MLKIYIVKSGFEIIFKIESLMDNVSEFPEELFGKSCFDCMVCM